jgi:hypothetical protein
MNRIVVTVCDETGRRDAARLITVEFPGYEPSFAYEGESKNAVRVKY